MKKKVLVYLIMMILAYTAEVYAAGVPSSVKELVKSTVTVTASKDFGSEIITGAVIGKKADYIIISAKALEGYTGDIVVSYGDTRTNASVSTIDKAKDIAVLNIEKRLDGTKPIKLRKGKTEAEVYIVNCNSEKDPGSILQGNIQDTSVLSVGESLSVKVYTITAPVTRDDNSAILSDKNGTLAGICLYDGDTTVNKAITSEEICSVLDNNNIPYKKATILYRILFIAFLAAVLAVIIYFIVNIWMKKQKNRPMLDGLSGDFAGISIPLTEESINIGRDAKCCQVVILDDQKVSRCHCSIRFDNIKHIFVLTDLSSTHGTYIDNNTRLEPNVPAYLNPGTIFRIGDNTTFRVKAGGDSI